MKQPEPAPRRQNTEPSAAPVVLMVPPEHDLRRVARRFSYELGGAPFPAGSSFSLPGGEELRPCNGCPSRSSCQQSLFDPADCNDAPEAVVMPDRCLDPACYEAKRRAWLGDAVMLAEMLWRQLRLQGKIIPVVPGDIWDFAGERDLADAIMASEAPEAFLARAGDPDSFSVRRLDDHRQVMGPFRTEANATKIRIALKTPKAVNPEAGSGKTFVGLIVDGPLTGQMVVLQDEADVDHDAEAADGDDPGAVAARERKMTPEQREELANRDKPDIQEGVQ